MSAYELKDVIHLWDVGKLTEEQAIGQSLLLLRDHQERLGEIERRLQELSNRTRQASGGPRTNHLIPGKKQGPCLYPKQNENRA